MNSGTIAVVKPGQKLPEELLTKILTNQKTLAGFAGVSQGMIDLIHMDDPKIDVKKEVEELLTTYSDSYCMFFFAQNPTLLKEDYFPMVLLNNEDKQPVIVCAAEGDFPTMVKKGDAHTPEYNLVMDFLAEEVDTIVEEAGGDVDKATELLNSPRFRKAIKNYLVPRGAVSILLGNNQVISFGEKTYDADGTGATGDWGSVSRRWGWTAPKATVVPDAAARPMSAVEMIRARKAAEKAAEGAPIMPQQPNQPVPGTGPQPKVLEPTTTEDLETVICPERGEKDRKKWMWRHFGRNWSFPQGWKNDNFKFPAKDLLETSPLRTFLDEERKKREGAPEPAPVEQPTVPQSPGVSTEVYPTLSPQSQESAMNLIRDGSLKGDPNVVKAIEKSFDKFTDQLHINEDLPLMWPTEGFQMLCQHNVAAAVSLMEQMRRRILQLDPSIASKMLSKLAAGGKTDVPTEGIDLTGLSAVEIIKLRKQGKIAA